LKGEDLLVFFGTQLGAGVRDLDVELFGALQDRDALAARDAVRDFSGVRAVVHQQHVHVRRVEHAKLVESAGQLVSVQFVGTVTDIRHVHRITKPTSNSTVDTLRLAPFEL
jgi:hypothetical protein